MSEKPTKKNIDWDTVLNTVEIAVRDFAKERVKPTLRTIFYYLVSKELIPNTQTSYKGLSRVLVEARKNQRFAWDFMEDKTRNVYGTLADNRSDFDSDYEYFEQRGKEKLEEIDVGKLIDEFFDYLSPSFNVDMWADQERVAEIWIEKEALASTIQAWTGDLHLPIRVNRGYASWTFIHNNCESLKSEMEKHEHLTIFYLGDLDPSGMDIQRFLTEAIEYFGMDPEKVELIRLAITEDHVREFHLPPAPKDAETLAKLAKDTRSRNYTKAFIVELDALVAFAPAAFRKMIRSAILAEYEPSVYTDLKEQQGEWQEKAEERLKEIKEEAMKTILEQIRGKGV